MPHLSVSPPCATTSFTSAHVGDANVWVTVLPTRVRAVAEVPVVLQAARVAVVVPREASRRTLTVSVDVGFTGSVSKYATVPFGFGAEPR